MTNVFASIKTDRINIPNSEVNVGQAKVIIPPTDGDEFLLLEAAQTISNKTITSEKNTIKINVSDIDGVLPISKGGTGTTSGHITTEVVDKNNSADINLSVGRSYVGEYTDVGCYNSIRIMANIRGKAELTVQHSADVSAENIFVSTKKLADTSCSYVFDVVAKYMRVVIDANAGTIVSGSIQTILHKEAANVMEAADGEIAPDINVPVVKSIVSALSPLGDIRNVNMTNDGGLYVSAKSYISNIRSSEGKTIAAGLDVDVLVDGGGLVTAGNMENVMSIIPNSKGSRAVCQSKYVVFQPNRPMIYTMSGVLITSLRNGITSRIGCFDRKSDKMETAATGDGYFFQYTAGILSIVSRNDDIDIAIPQSSWNIDKLDGSGKSGVTIIPTSRQTYVIILSQTSVLAGIIIGNEMIPCHSYNYTNDSLISPPIMRYGLPVRYEILTDGTSKSPLPAIMKQMMYCIESDLGYVLQTKKYAVSRPAIDSDKEIPLISLRLKNPRTKLEVKKISVYSSNLSEIYVYKTAGNYLNGESFVDISSAEYDLSATGVDAPTYSKIYSTYVNGGVAVIDIDTFLYADIQGISEVLTVVAVPINESSRYLTSVCWEEYY